MANNKKITIEVLARMVSAGFGGVDKRFDGIDKRFDGVDKRLDGVDKRLERIEKKLEGVVYRREFEEMGERVKYLEDLLAVNVKGK